MNNPIKKKLIQEFEKNIKFFNEKREKNKKKAKRKRIFSIIIAIIIMIEVLIIAYWVAMMHTTDPNVVLSKMAVIISSVAMLFAFAQTYFQDSYKNEFEDVVSLLFANTIIEICNSSNINDDDKQDIINEINKIRDKK